MELSTETLFLKLVLPLCRLVLIMAGGLLLAQLLEALHWTRFVARLATPMVRLGHLRDVAGASFALAFFSPAAANALLAESHARKELSGKELVFANLLNSSPTFLVHLPTLFSLAYAFLGRYALVYVGLTFLAALVRTLATLCVGRVALPAPEQGCAVCGPEGDAADRSWRQAAHKALRRFKRRLGRLVLFTVPVYCLIFAMQYAGWFAAAERFMAEHAAFLPFLRPEALSIVALHLAAESGAALSAAASLLNSGALAPREIIMALLAGNILSSPVRAVRHQLPSYMGFFPPRVAVRLVFLNQACRVGSLVLAGAGYYAWAF